MSGETPDSRQLCLLVGTCITFGLHYLLSMSEDFRQRYRLQAYRTHRHQQFMSDFAIGDEELNAASVFIYHTPGWADWGNEQGYHELLARVPAHVQRISIPYPIFPPLWPFHVYDPRNDAPDRALFPHGAPAHYPYGDGVVLRMMRQGLPKEEIIRRYLDMDVSDEIGLDALLEKSIEIQAVKEENTDVKVLDFVASEFRRQPAFLTMNHVGNPTLIHMADQILGRLGCAPLGPFAHRGLFHLVSPQMPIHPSVIRHFGLTYVTPESRYAFDAFRNLTLEEYLSFYIDFA